MLTITNVSQRYDEQPVLNDIDLTVQRGEILCLLGESGSGKTTLLRIIAGLETDYSGAVEFEDQSLRSVPVHQRNMGMVFQDFALFPHMNVQQNVAFGLRMAGMPRKQRDKRVAEVLELVGMETFAQRDVGQLSGGEQQRVALARSLAPEPALLLLDEPLGALDAGLKERLVVELRQIIKRVGLTAIYVTHDQTEAYAIADRIAILHDGQLAQIDTPQALYQRPQTAYVAQFLGLGNIVTAAALHGLDADVGTDGPLLLHPLGVSIAESGTLSATVTALAYRGDHYRVTAELSSGERLRFKHDVTPGTVLEQGQGIRLHIDPEQVIELTH